ncbi:MAG: DUF4358 domain-containing protein [Parasporobacterium sp.]|nr:DUF4358 domain-containing protein [Parasporobacterium sp.]
MTRRAFLLRILSILMVIALAVVIIVSLSRSSGSSRPVGEVASAITGLFENEKSQLSPERTFRKLYGLNAQDYEGVVLYSPISNMDAEELLLVKLKNEDQAEELVAAVEKRLQTQTGIYEGYAPPQYELCQNGVIDLQGNYLLYVVHADADRIDAEYQKALRE